jgi:hypothetical protein
MNIAITQSRLRELVRLNLATDISNEPEPPKNLIVIGVTYGIYGIDGAVLENTENSNKYVIIGRCSNLFKYV